MANQRRRLPLRMASFTFWDRRPLACPPSRGQRGDILRPHPPAMMKVLPQLPRKSPKLYCLFPLSGRLLLFITTNVRSPLLGLPLVPPPHASASPPLLLRTPPPLFDSLCLFFCVARNSPYTCSLRSRSACNSDAASTRRHCSFSV